MQLKHKNTFFNTNKVITHDKSKQYLRHHGQKLQQIH